MMFGHAMWAAEADDPQKAMAWLVVWAAFFVSTAHTWRHSETPDTGAPQGETDG
jgi:hypothetical protein